MQEFKEKKQLSIDMHCSHVHAQLHISAITRGCIINSSLID